MLIIFRSMKTGRKRDKCFIQWLAECKKAFNFQISQSQLKENIVAGVKRAKTSAITPWTDKRYAVVNPIKRDKSKPKKIWKSLATLTRKSHLRTKFGTNSWVKETVPRNFQWANISLWLHEMAFCKREICRRRTVNERFGWKDTVATYGG